MPLATEIVKNALGTDLSPDDIVSLSREPLRVVSSLEEAYSLSPPDYALPPKGSLSRPFVAYGRESAGSSEWRAPSWRATAAVQMLVYCHEVVIADPVEWFLTHPYAEPRDEQRARDLLSSIAQLAPLIDAGLVRLMPHASVVEARSSQQKESESEADFERRMYDFYSEVARLLYGRFTGSDLDGVADLFRLIWLSNQTKGEVDISSHPGNYWVIEGLRNRGWRLPSEIGVMPPSEALVVVPDISKITATDLIRLRERDAFAIWRKHLELGRQRYESSLLETRSATQAESAFLETMASAAAAVQRDIEKRSSSRHFKTGLRQVGISAVGALPLLSWGLEAYLVGTVGKMGEGAARQLFSIPRLKREAAELAAMGRHFQTLIP